MHRKDKMELRKSMVILNSNLLSLFPSQRIENEQTGKICCFWPYLPPIFILGFR